VRVTWQPPVITLQNGIIYGYRVRVAAAVAPAAIIDDIDAGQGTALLVARLQPDTAYTFSVAAYTLQGNGVASEAVITRTLEDIPAGAPLAVQADATNSTAVRVAWLLPAPEDRSGIIVAFHVRLLSSEAQAERTIVVPSLEDATGADVVIDALQPFTSVQVLIGMPWQRTRVCRHCIDIMIDREQPLPPPPHPPFPPPLPTLPSYPPLLSSPPILPSYPPL